MGHAKNFQSVIETRPRTLVWGRDGFPFGDTKFLIMTAVQGEQGESQRYFRRRGPVSGARVSLFVEIPTESSPQRRVTPDRRSNPSLLEESQILDGSAT